MKHYTVYLRATDEIVAVGTAKECTKQLGMANEQVFRAAISRAKNNKRNKYEVIIEDTPYDEEDE